MRSGVTKKSAKELENCKEPSQEEIEQYMEKNKENYYNARERLRELAYGGKPPHGYSDWGTYWEAV